MKKGVIELIPVLVTFMVIAIITFNVVLPTLNNQLVNASTQPANLSGNLYGGALATAQQLPLLTVVILIVSVAAIIMFAIGGRQ